MQLAAPYPCSGETVLLSKVCYHLTSPLLIQKVYHCLLVKFGRPGTAGCLVGGGMEARTYMNEDAYYRVLKAFAVGSYDFVSVSTASDFWAYLGTRHPDLHLPLQLVGMERKVIVSKDCFVGCRKRSSSWLSSALNYKLRTRSTPR